MAENWTGEQSSAIDTRGVGIVVPAAAGSGKTAVLIERAIRMLSDEENKVPADTLLCVTFTNAAAAQLREKLTKALGEQAARYPENSWLAQQQSKLQTARIVTINAFCLELVKNNAHALGLQSDLRIMEENDTLLLRKEMLGKAVDCFYENHPEKMDLVHKKFSTKRWSIINAAEIMYKYLRSIPFADDYMQKSLAKLRSDDGCISFCKALMKQAADKCFRARTLIENCLELFERSGCMEDGVKNVLNGDLCLIRNIEDTLLSEDDGTVKERYTRTYALLSGIKFETMRFPRQNKDGTKQLGDIEQFKEQIQALRGQAKDHIGDIREIIICPFEEAAKDCAMSADVAEIFYDIVKCADELISEEKKERGCCDFADVELMTVSLLAEKENGVIHRTELCEEIVEQGEFGTIMIDEFQDTNDLQELIFKCISNTQDLNVFGTNVFIVGDIKQAIYQFRRSDPKLFAAARAAAADEKYKDNLREIVLTQNFRSRKNIIDTANFMFSRLMSKTVGEVDYVSSERLNYGAKCYDSRDDLPTRFAVCSKENEFDEAARIIKETLMKGVLVYDKDIKSQRACRPSDFCILTRTNKVNFTAAQALGKYGLKVASREISGYLLSREISLMTSLLKVIDDPLNDAALLAVMLSPILQFTDEEAAKLKISAKSDKASLYSIMTDISKNEKYADKALAKKCENALQKIRRYRYLACAMAMSQLIRKLYTETNFYILASALSGGERSQANLRLLLDIADGYDSNSVGGLSGFIRYFDEITENGKDFSQAALATETNDAVNVMTMHKSKGLEFPFVILTQLEHEFLSEKSDSIVMNEYGIGIKITDSELFARYYTAAFTAIAAEKEREAISEAMRLLYVSVTRAREQLIIMIPRGEGTGANKMIMNAAKRGCISPDTALSAKCMLDWVLTAFAYHAGRDELEKQLGIDYAAIDDISDECNICVTCEGEEPTDGESEDSTAADADISLVKKLAASIASPQPKPLPDEAKLSVTDIVHKKREERAFRPWTSNAENQQSFTAAEKGTLTHLFMELCDIKNAVADFDGEFDRVMSLGRFSPQEAKQIYIDALRKFFKGGVAKRMAASDEILREKQFLVKISDMALDKELFSDIAGSDGMLQGVADCVFKEDGCYVLVDYKTDKVSTADVLSQRYSRQLELYRAALDIILDAPVKECVICSLYLGTDIKV